jgi:hypothetical protein
MEKQSTLHNTLKSRIGDIWSGVLSRSLKSVVFKPYAGGQELNVTLTLFHEQSLLLRGKFFSCPNFISLL